MKVKTFTIFLGGPFSAAMKLTSEGIGFDPKLKRNIEDMLRIIEGTGSAYLSSHIADQFGTQFDAAQIVPRDNNWVAVCDLYVALLPFDDTGKPYRTDGTFVEIGLALAQHKHVLLIMEQPDHVDWSYYVKNLATADEAMRIVEWRSFWSAPEQTLQWAKAQAQGLGTTSQEFGRQQTTNAVDVLQGLASRNQVEQISFKGMDLRVFPDVFSPRVSHAPDYIVENWSIPPGCNVLDLGCGSGVLGLYALRCGAGQLTAIDINPAACDNVRANADTLGYSDRVTVLRGSGYDALQKSDSFDVIILSPPYWNKEAHTLLESSCFDLDHRFLALSLLGAARRLTTTGSVFLIFSDQGDLSTLAHLIEQSGLSVRTMKLQRPTMPGGHIRLFYVLGHPAL